MPVTTNGAENKQGKGKEEEKGSRRQRRREIEERRKKKTGQQQPVHYCHCPENRKEFGLRDGFGFK